MPPMHACMPACLAEPCPAPRRRSPLAALQQVQIQACFRPGDVVRAEVLSLGDARSYHLTTARNELGVVYARSVAGEGSRRRRCKGQECRLVQAWAQQRAWPATPAPGAICSASLLSPHPCAPRAGAPMVPVSWQEMQCPTTQALENRKVAKLSS